MLNIIRPIFEKSLNSMLPVAVVVLILYPMCASSGRVLSPTILAMTTLALAFFFIH